MARITSLPEMGAPAGDESLPIVKGGKTYRAKVSDLTEAASIRAETAAAFAEEFSGQAYMTRSAGELDTLPGQFFRVASGTTPETYIRYRRTDTGSIEAAALATTMDLSNPEDGKGADLVAGAGKAVTDRSTMRELSSPGDWTRPLFLTEHNREGTFVSRTESELVARYGLDFASAAARDPVEGIFIFSDDGTHVWVRQYGGVIQLKWFGAVGDGDANDSPAIAAFAAILSGESEAVGELGSGVFAFDTTIELTKGARCIRGLPAGQRTGSARLATTLKWTGGVAPMFRTSTTAHNFENFGVETNGLATDFLEMNDGSQRVFMTDVFFGYEIFTRSVIRSNGNRIGYSKFHRINAVKPAPKFIDLDGQNTSNGATPIMFTECAFANVGTGGGNPWTVLHVKGELIEHVAFERCLFISRGGTVVVDTTDSPLPSAINVLTVTNCEIDNVEGANLRMFKLQNVDSIMVDGNVMTGDGYAEYLFECLNSNVTSFRGNWWKSISYIFDLADDCLISGVGLNAPDWSSTQGVHNNPKATKIELAQSGAIVIDGSRFTPSETGHVNVDLTTGAGYEFRVDTSRPENMEPGQRFDITVRNVSGGGVSAGAFHPGQFKAPAPVAPAPGFSRTYSFRFNGTHAVETGRSTADVPN
ncbi:hypothetical protein [Qipengyuania flava]|uniref:hypothetical protein n=1 Tax=Qipengyuania flava TaxID=192812 RepID=UPI00273F4CD7|nr:hypothetical protein [Qipengyuania flava]